MASTPLNPPPSGTAGSTTGLLRDHRLLVRMIEAKNLPPEIMDTHCLIQIDSNPSSQVWTKTIWKSQNPFYDEEYEFLLERSFKMFTVEIFNKNKFTKDTCVGVVKMPRLSLELDNLYHEAWFPIFPPNTRDEMPSSPRDNEAKRPHSFTEKYFAVPRNCDFCTRIIWKSQAMICSDCGFVCHAKCSDACKPTCGTKGVIRLRYKYTDEYILSLPYYPKLLELMVQDNSDLVSMFGKVTEEREEAAKTLVRIMEYMNQAVPFINQLNDFDVKNSEEKTIFRANSLGSKGLDYYMKMIGMGYLFDVLKPVMDDILKQEKSCEIDPSRLEKGEELETNKANLLGYIDAIVSKIFDSISQCPIPLRRIFHHLQDIVVKKYPDNEVIRYTSVSGYLFLRFFNAAILGPKLFGLSPDHPNQKVSRTLTLISKTVQQLANLIHFDGKEPYMTTLNEFIFRNKDTMKLFIRKIASVPDSTVPSILPSAKAKKEQFTDKKKSKIATMGPTKIDLGGDLGDLSSIDIDIRLELGNLHRLFIRARSSLEELQKQTGNESIKKLLDILSGLDAITEKRKKEAEEEREKEAQKAIQEDYSLEEFLGISPKKFTFAKASRPSASESSSLPRSPLSISTRDIDSDLADVADVEFRLKSDCLISVKELFGICDRSRTGFISRDDFETILMSQDIDPKGKDVINAFASKQMPIEFSSISYSDFAKIIAELVEMIHNPAPTDELKVAAENLLGYLGESSQLSFQQIEKLLANFGKSSLTESQSKRLLEAMKAKGQVELLPFVLEL